MESIIYNKFLGQCLWTLCLKTMRGTGIGMVSMSPIMNPQSRGATSFRTPTPTKLREFFHFFYNSRGATSGSIFYFLLNSHEIITIEFV